MEPLATLATSSEPAPERLTIEIKGSNAVILREALENLQITKTHFLRSAVLEKLRRLGYTVLD